MHKRKGERMYLQQKDSFWLYCPICNAKTRTMVYDDTVLLKFPLYCPKCKGETMVNVVQLKMTICDT